MLYCYKREFGLFLFDIIDFKKNFRFIFVSFIREIKIKFELLIILNIGNDL